MATPALVTEMEMEMGTQVEMETGIPGETETGMPVETEMETAAARRATEMEMETPALGSRIPARRWESSSVRWRSCKPAPT
jgi:hypothetical protein